MTTVSNSELILSWIQSRVHQVLLTQFVTARGGNGQWMSSACTNAEAIRTTGNSGTLNITTWLWTAKNSDASVYMCTHVQCSQKWTLLLGRQLFTHIDSISARNKEYSSLHDSVPNAASFHSRQVTLKWQHWDNITLGDLIWTWAKGSLRESRLGRQKIDALRTTLNEYHTNNITAWFGSDVDKTPKRPELFTIEMGVTRGITPLLIWLNIEASPTATGAGPDNLTWRKQVLHTMRWFASGSQLLWWNHHDRGCSFICGVFRRANKKAT